MAGGWILYDIILLTQTKVSIIATSLFDKSGLFPVQQVINSMNVNPNFVSVKKDNNET